jgi:uncharacterized membrane protein HdeD (DUF308 family)
MLDILTRHWWLITLRGVAVIIFGILAFAWPELTLLTLVLLFGAYALVDGILGIITGIAAKGVREQWWVMILGGVAGIIVGVLTFLWPGITALVLLYIIAAWALITGILEIVFAIQLRRLISHEWLMILAGILSILFGLLLVLLPGPGALSLIWLIGAYALVFGIAQIVFSLRLRSIGKKIKDSFYLH